MAKDRDCDVLVAGGGMGGVAAALAAATLGRDVVLTEETDWVGGQLTSQAVSCPDEHPWIEMFGGTRSYYRLREGVRDLYRRGYPLTPDARAEPHLNPGGGNVSRLCAEPRAWLYVLHQMLLPHQSAGRITVLLRHRPVAADVDADRVGAVTFADDRNGDTAAVRARYVVDATELGDLLPLAGCEYVSGAEGQSDTGEPHAVSGPPQPDNVQSFTVCFLMDYRPGEDHTIDRPRGYDGFRTGVPLDWVQPHPVTREPRLYGLFPDDAGAAYPLWLYRRVLDRARHAAGTFPSDVTLVNWPQNDFCGGNLIDKPDDEAARLVDEAKRLSLSLLYWMQTEAPRPDGGTGWPGLRLRPDMVGTADGLAKYPYIRESRRILPVFRVVEEHIASDLRGPDAYAEPFFDSVGIGLYRIDLHPSSQGEGYLDIGCCPFQIPLGALLPRRMTNLLAGNKNLGTTHITNGAYRLHPVEWNIGESAGALAAFCADRNVAPHAVREDRELLSAFQRTLERLGVPLRWPQARPI